MKHLRHVDEKKPKGAPDWHDSDAPDANGRFRDLSIKDLAAWLIKTRKKDVKRISGSLTQQIVFNRNDDPKYAEKMEKTRKEVYKQLGREDLLESKREDVGKYNTVKKVIKELGRRPSEQELATFINNNYYDVTEVERGDDDPAANDKIADLVAFYKFDIDDWNIAWFDAQNESVVTESFRVGKVIAIKKYNAKTNRKEVVDVRVTDYIKKPGSKDFVEYDLKGKKRKVSVDVFKSMIAEGKFNVNEGMSKERMIKQIERALKDGLSIFKLPMATQTYYRKNKSDFETIEEGNYKMEDIYDLIAHHRFDKDFKKLSSKDKEWVENDAKERGFNESLLESDMFNMYYSLIDELYEAKPGPDAYMTGLSDEEKEEKEAKMKKQADMDDDDPDSYEELPGDEEAREKGKVKKSKHTTAYNKKFKGESMKNLKSFDNFVTEKRSDIWSPYQKADILAGDMFGAMGLYGLEDDELNQIIDLKKADKLAKKMFGEFGFKTLAAKEMEDLLDNNPKLLRESVVNEAEKYDTEGFKVGDKIKTNFGEWEVIETDYAPKKSFIAPFIFKGKDMKRVDIPNPPKTNKNAVGYKVTDGAKYPTIGFLYQYKDITKLATVGVDESLVNEEKIKYAKGKTYQSSGHYTVMVDSNSSMCDIRVNHSAGWRLDPHDDREETWELLDGGRQRATIYFRRGSIDKFAQQMFDLNDRTTWGNKTKLTAKDYADIIRLWIDMKKANEVKEKKSLNEAKLSTVHRAAKKGSYPAVIVVVQDGKVIHQEPVSTPEVAPATFNVMQKKYPKALLHLEDKTGKRLFSESVVTEAESVEVGEYIKTQYGYFYKRVTGKVGGQEAFVEIKKGKEGKRKTSIHDTVSFEIVDAEEALNENRMLRKGQFRFGAKLQYGIEDVNESYGFYGTLIDQFGLDEVNELFLDGFAVLETNYDFTDQAALYYLNSKAGRWVADQVTEKLIGPKNMSPYYGHLEEIFAEYAKKGQWKKWAKEYDQFAEEDNMEEGLMIRESKSDMDEYYRELLEAEQTTNDQGPLGDDGMETGIKNKAKESGVPVGLLRIIMRRGLAAWKTGHRPGATQAQWGYARVNSFLTKQPGTWGKADSDIAKKVRDGGHDKNL